MAVAHAAGPTMTQRRRRQLIAAGSVPGPNEIGRGASPSPSEVLTRDVRNEKREMSSEQQVMRRGTKEEQQDESRSRQEGSPRPGRVGFQRAGSRAGGR